MDIKMMIIITAWSSQRVCYFEIKVNVVIAASFLTEVSLKAPDDFCFKFGKHPKYYVKYTRVFLNVLLKT